MQFAAITSQVDWQELLGWAFIVAGLALAGGTLILARPNAGAAHILRAYRPAEWSARQSTHERVRPMDDAKQWERMVAIAEKGFIQVATIAELPARAAVELESVEDGLVQLLAEYKPGAALPLPEPKPLPAPPPTPVAEPLAA
jgi:hypothetical protein